MSPSDAASPAGAPISRSAHVEPPQHHRPNSRRTEAASPAGAPPVLPVGASRSAPDEPPQHHRPNPRQTDASSRAVRSASARLQGLGNRAFFRPRDAAAVGVDSRALRKLVDSGAVERLERGLYHRSDFEPTEHYTRAAVCARVPDGVLCLLTALSIHELGTQVPWQVWIAIPHKARTPRLHGLPVQIVRFSGSYGWYGIQETKLDGVPVRITSPARTVVDCFRLRRLVGLDTALEAVRDALRDRKATPREIWRTAEACRARSLLRPVLEVLTA